MLRTNRFCRELDNLVRSLIVDDELLSRKRIRRFLCAEQDFEIVAESENGKEAVAAIQEYSPDVVFLDVQMPGMSGFDVIATIGVEHMPLTIFTTAFDEYAVRAFEVHALDYLLKPISRSRFHAVLKRVRSNLAQTRQLLEPHLLDLLVRRQEDAQALTRLLIKSEGKVIFLNTREIDWIQAEGNYVRVQAGPTAHLLRQTLSRLTKDLDANRFLRIHRSTIVNIERIKELRPCFHGDYIVHLRDGKRLTLSRTYREEVRKILKQSF